MKHKHYKNWSKWFNSSKTSYAYKHQWFGLPLVQLWFVACMVPGHFLNEFWLMSTALPVQGSFNQNMNNFFQGNALENVYVSMCHSNGNGQSYVPSTSEIQSIWQPLYTAYLLLLTFPQWAQRCLIICYWTMEWSEAFRPISGYPELYFNMRSVVPKAGIKGRDK